MPDPRAEYARLAARSRPAAASLARETIATLYEELARLLVRLDAAAAAGDGAFTAERAQRLATSVRRLLDDLSVSMAVTIGDGALAAVRLAPVAHVAAVKAAAAVAGVATPSVSFAEVPRRAVAALMARRELAATYGIDSYSGLFRVVTDRAVAGIGPQLDVLMTDQVARGVSTRRATTEIASLIAQGDPELLRAVQRIGPRGGLRRRIEAAVDLPPKAALDEARKLMKRSERVARTEILTAHLEGDRLAAATSPVVSAVKWNLSGNHPPSGCACEVYSSADLYEMGEGVFPVNACPTRPHPHCGCNLGYVLRGPAEWSQAKPRARTAAALDRYPLAGYSDAHGARVQASVNRALAVAFEP